MRTFFATQAALLSLLYLAQPCSAVVQDEAQRYSSPNINQGYLTNPKKLMAIDSAGNAFVAGTRWVTPDNTDFAIVKYGSDGTRLWERTFDSPAPYLSWDTPVAAATDPAGNFYITGYTYNPTQAHYDLILLKFDTTSKFLWGRVYNNPVSPTANDFPRALTTDSAGNVYVTAVTQQGEEGGSVHFVLLKYAPNGAWLRATRYQGGGPNDGPIDIAVDNSGNAYVTGIYTANDTQDIFTLKFNTNAAQNPIVWARRFNGSGNGNDRPSAIAVDSAGNSYVTGAAEATGGAMNMITFKYSSGGQLLWASRYGSPGLGRAIVVDGQGFAYVAGEAFGNLITIKYNTLKASSPVVWGRWYGGDGTGANSAYDIAIDSQRNVYITGMVNYVFGSNTADMFTACYNANGTTRWSDLFDGEAHGDDQGRVVKVDAAGNVHVGGLSASSATKDLVVVRYRP